MRERILGGYDNFVIPFMIGMVFIIVYLFIGLIRLFKHIPARDRKRYLISLITPKIIYKNIRDIIADSLLHIKIFKRNFLLGYMHASIAFGWFMLIVIGHIEVALYVPERNGVLYYPVFFRYFVKQEGDLTLRGAFFFFLMDLFLLIVISGVALAMYKRVRSTALGMRRTTKPCLADRVALICLWAIFPLRLLAESFTAGISGGSFLTKPMHMMFANFLGNDLNVEPTWWAYSIALGLFFLALPFSRYMHIPTEALLITLRNAGLKVTRPRKGFAEAEIYSCSSCGICLDACPMNIQKKNIDFSAVYFIRFLRRHNTKKINKIAEKCLMCGKCVALCPVGIESCNIRMAQRATVTNNLKYDYSYLNQGAPESHIKAEEAPSIKPTLKREVKDEKILYFAGCMTHQTPSIIKAMINIFEKSDQEYIFADKDGGICCGRPLMLAGKFDAAKEVINRVKELILSKNINTIVLSCPICYKVFKDEYKLKGIKALHHTQYINELISSGRLEVTKGSESFTYHDPCDLGRGSKIYKEPRKVIESIGELKKIEKEKKQSICCGGSLGSLTLNYADRKRITQGSLDVLTYDNPDKIITACPLCLKSFNRYSDRPILDIAEIVDVNSTSQNKNSNKEQLK